MFLLIFNPDLFLFSLAFNDPAPLEMVTRREYRSDFNPSKKQLADWNAGNTASADTFTNPAFESEGVHKSHEVDDLENS